LGELASCRNYIDKIEIPSGSIKKIALRPVVQNIPHIEDGGPKDEIKYKGLNGSNENSKIIKDRYDYYKTRHEGETDKDFKFTVYDFVVPSYLIKTIEDMQSSAESELAKISFLYLDSNNKVATKPGTHPDPSTTLPTA
jgi:hypothetical protein